MKKLSTSERFNIDVESLLLLPNADVYLKDLQGVYLECNDSMAKNINLSSPRACIGITDYDYGLSQNESCFLRRNDKKVTYTNSVQYFTEIITLDKRKINLLSTKMPLKNRYGKIIGLFGISYHIAENENTINISQDNFDLSNQQLESLFWLTKGMTIKQIAKTMILSPRTIETYLQMVKTKLNCSSRNELIQYALKTPSIKNRL